MHDQLVSVSLDDKYTVTSGRIYLNGVQALVRLMLCAALARYGGRDQDGRLRVGLSWLATGRAG